MANKIKISKEDFVGMLYLYVIEAYSINKIKDTYQYSYQIIRSRFYDVGVMDVSVEVEYYILMEHINPYMEMCRDDLEYISRKGGRMGSLVDLDSKRRFRRNSSFRGEHDWILFEKRSIFKPYSHYVSRDKLQKRQFTHEDVDKVKKVHRRMFPEHYKKYKKRNGS